MYNPEYLHLDITGECNAHCAHCGNDSRSDNGANLDAYTISRIMREAGEQEFLFFDVSGGEIFLQLDKLKHTIKEGVENGLVPHFIGTNAYFAKSVDEAKDALKELKEVGFGKKYSVETKKIKKTKFFKAPKKQYQESKGGGLGISFDTFHKQFVGVGNISNLIRAYYEVFDTTEDIILKSGRAKNHDLIVDDLIDLLIALDNHGFEVAEQYESEKNILETILEEHKIRLNSGAVEFSRFKVDPVGRAKNLIFDLIDISEEVFKEQRYCCGIFNQGPAGLFIDSKGNSYVSSDFICRSDGLYLGNIYEKSLEELIHVGKNSLIADIVSFDGAYMLREFMKKANMDINIKSNSACHFCYQVLSDEKKINQLAEYYGGLGRIKMFKYDLAKLELRLHGMGIIP